LQVKWAEARYRFRMVPRAHPRAKARYLTGYIRP